MLINSFKTTLRHLWRQRLFTTLNVFGLAISISAGWIIYRIISYEFSYDATLPNKENIYKVITAFDSKDKNSKMAGVAAPLYQGIRQEIPGLENVVPVFGQWITSIEIKRENKIFTKDDPGKIVATDASYFDMLPYKWLAGNKATALNTHNKVVLTESRAKEYFPNKAPQDILNETIVYYGWKDTVLRTVTGIVADNVTPSQFTHQEFFSLNNEPYKLNSWTNTNGTDQLFLQFKKGVNTSSTLKQINDLSARKWKEFATESGNNLKMSKRYELVPIQQVHFATDVEEYGVTRASKPVMYGLIGIGIFLLLLACINYINMSVAQIPKRGKEIGVRKTLGSGQWQLISQFLNETFLTTLLACAVAFFLSRFGFWLLKDIIPDGVTLVGSAVDLLIFLIGLMLTITVLAGLYPSWLIAKLRTANMFRNFTTTKNTDHRFTLQKALIVFQFVIALLFIASSIIVGSQLRYTLKADMGFNKDAVVLVSLPFKYLNDPRFKNKQFILCNQLKKQPGIEDIALGSAPLSSSYSSSPFVYNPENKNPIKVQTYKKWVDTAYLNLYQIKLLAGRNLYASDTAREYLINETAAKAFGFATPQEAIGKMVAQLGNAQYPIVGVVSDFNTQNFYTKMTPVAILSGNENLYTFNIKLNSHNPDQWQKVLNAIEKQWYEFYPPESFHYSFYDETLENMYKQERQIAKLIDLATFITIFISCLGLFGLVTLTAYQRTKEISIRKVLGASVTGIASMLSKGYLVQIVIAIFISIPISWWAMNKWLQDFAYRIHLSWWMFLVAGVLAILIALVTVSFQAIKAAIANPVKSLRTE